MTKDVLIAIAGLQFDIDSDETIEVITVGQYYKKDDKHYIFFDEILEETGETVKNRIKIGEDQVEILKSGASNVHMVFETGKKNITYYSTPFGNLMIGIDTLRIDLEEELEQILLKIDYVLDVNYAHVSDCSIKLRITSKKVQKQGANSSSEYVTE
ncbi:MAG TPA: DUF1934 domain-containing protein [Lachnospiraceae bacterium]|nr:DUF1934 domain-containing protein [Lachnospiraceae bacterium]